MCLNVDDEHYFSDINLTKFILDKGNLRCHKYCVGGCYGPHETDCYACKNVTYNGTCYPDCKISSIYKVIFFKYNYFTLI